MHLEDKHLKLLKQIKKEYVVRTNKHEIEDVEYLRSLGLITASSVDKKDDFYYHPRITEKGKAILYERFVRRFEQWVPVIVSNLISIAALIVAIIALCKK